MVSVATRWVHFSEADAGNQKHWTGIVKLESPRILLLHYWWYSCINIYKTYTFKEDEHAVCLFIYIYVCICTYRSVQFFIRLNTSIFNHAFIVFMYVLVLYFIYLCFYFTHSGKVVLFIAFFCRLFLTFLWKYFFCFDQIYMKAFILQ